MRLGIPFCTESTHLTGVVSLLPQLSTQSSNCLIYYQPTTTMTAFSITAQACVYEVRSSNPIYIYSPTRQPMIARHQRLMVIRQSITSSQLISLDSSKDSRPRDRNHDTRSLAARNSTTPSQHTRQSIRFLSLPSGESQDERNAWNSRSCV